MTLLFWVTPASVLSFLFASRSLEQQTPDK
jgi:hypothetical protein